MTKALRKKEKETWNVVLTANEAYKFKITVNIYVYSVNYTRNEIHVK
jgi:hypothetical protein